MDQRGSLVRKLRAVLYGLLAAIVPAHNVVRGLRAAAKPGCKGLRKYVYHPSNYVLPNKVVSFEAKRDVQPVYNALNTFTHYMYKLGLKTRKLTFSLSIASNHNSFGEVGLRTMGKHYLPVSKSYVYFIGSKTYLKGYN